MVRPTSWNKLEEEGNVIGSWRRLATIVAFVASSTLIAAQPFMALADGTDPLHYHYGPVATSPRVFVVFWGSEWNSGWPAGTEYTAQQVMNYVTNFFQNVGGSYWLSAITQYYQSLNGVQTYISNQPAQYGGSGIDNQTLPATFKTDDVSTEIGAYAVPHFANNDYKNNVYMVFTPPGHAPSDLGSDCGYHSLGPPSSLLYNYGYVAYPTSNCYASKVNSKDSFGHGPLDGLSITGGHEYAEAITDPVVRNTDFSTAGMSTGWWDHVRCVNPSQSFPCPVTADEIGDKCAVGTNEFPLYGNTWLGNEYFAVQGLWSNVIPGCSLLPGVAPSPFPTCTAPGLSASLTTQAVWKMVTFTASTSGCPTPTYQFSVLSPGGSWTVAQPYGLPWTFSWTPSTGGTYQVKVDVRDQTSSAAYEAESSISYVVTSPPTGLLVAENSSYTWVAHGNRLEKFNLGGAGANIFSTSTSGTTGPDALGYFDFGTNITAIAVNESYLYIGLSTGRVIKTTMCGGGYNPCQFSDNMGGFTMPGYSYWIGVQDYSLGAVNALAVNSNYLFASLGSRTVKTGLCTSGGSMCWANSTGTGPVAGGGGQYYGYMDWSAPVIAEAANDSYVFTSMYGNGLTRVCKSGLGSTGSDVFALSSGACTGNYPGYSDWFGYQDMSTPVVGLAVDPGRVFWSLGSPARVVQTNMCSTGGNVCAFSDGYGSNGLAGYGYWVGRQDDCSGYQEGSVTSSLANRTQNPWVDWAFSTGGGMSRIVQAYPGTGYNMFATGDCTDTGPYPGYSYWVGYQDLSI